MNTKFSDYFKENFFHDEKNLNIFLNSLTKKLTKTLRINTTKTSIKDLKKRLIDQNYKLTSTFQENVFYIEKGQDFNEQERRLGFTLEHLIGHFYIQELGASSSVFYLANGKIDKNPYLILDMAASPGGKTTQLSEYYPNSFIVANEFDSTRTKQLIMNIERMGCQNIGITNYNGQYLGRFENTFDKVLLDAPCSGEGTGFKSLEALKFWNIKNVKKISDLQKKLFEAGLNSLKIGGEMLYSTCTMNEYENEGIVSYVIEKHPGSFEIVFEKRFWPHIDETGGFFVCKIKKIKDIEYKTTKKDELANNNIKNLTKNEELAIDKFGQKVGLNFNKFHLLKYSNEIIILNKKYPYSEVRDRIYFFKLGQKIGKIENSLFIPNYYIGRDFGILNIPKYDLKDEFELDNYLRGVEIGNDLNGQFIQLIFEGIPIGLGEINSIGRINNLFPKLWFRK